MKVALIQCPGWGRDCPPYSLALLTAILREKNHEVFSFDINNALYCSGPDEYKKFWDDKDLYSFWSTKDLISKFIEDNDKMLEFQVESILNTAARVIGFTVHFSSLLVSLELARRLKAKDKERIVVFGGPDCCRQLRGLEIIEDSAVDVVNVGEGDLSILELLKQIENGGVEFVKGALIKKNGTIIDCGESEIIGNLDSLPFPDYSDFSEDISRGLYRQPERLEILDSRGCITKCHFCSEWQFWKRFRSMSGQRMFEEISYQIKIFPKVDYFYFIGSLLNGNIKALSEFCDLVIKNGLKIRWLGQAIVRSEMDKILLTKMRKAGCIWLGYGIESGSEKVLEKMNKRFSIKLAAQVLKDTHEAGIQTQANFMFGIPTETEVDFQQTLDFLKRNRQNMDSVLASQSFCVIDKDTYLYNHPEEFAITDCSHSLFWEAYDNNTYPERFRRYEEFCNLALSLGLPETSGVLRVKPDKSQLMSQYHAYRQKRDTVNKSYQPQPTGLDFKSLSGIESKKFAELLRNFTDTGYKGVDLGKIVSDFNFNDRQKSMAHALYSHGLWSKLSNYVLTEVQKARKETSLFSYPYWLVIDPCNYCTLQCPFCPTGQRRECRTKGKLNLDNFKNIIDKLGPYAIHLDLVNWGEPLLNEQISEMISYAKQYHCDIKIDTNLNHLDEKSAERLILSGLDKVIVSIDGLNQETYSKHRIGGDFKLAMDNLRLLVKKRRELNRLKPYITWQFLVFRHNEHEIKEAEKIGKSIGVDHVGITKAFIGYKDWMPQNPQYCNYNSQEIKEGELTSEHFKDAGERFCNWPWEAIVVNPNGSVSACCSVEEEKDDFGSIYELPFEELWNSKNYLSSRDYISKKDASIVKSNNGVICNGCRLSGLINADILSCHSFFDTL